MVRRLLLLWLIPCLIGWSALAVRGQTVTTTTLSGHIIDAATSKPLPFANVYLNGTTRGTTTDTGGSFLLTDVPLGTVEVVISFLGYQTTRQTLRLDNAQSKSLAIRLKPDNRMLRDVTVTAKSKDRTWQRQFRQFRRQLLGEPFGGQCRIVNSFALSFEETGGELSATATEPLIIDNQALGYRLTYDLIYFRGSVRQVYYGGTSRFDEITPTDERQKARFERNRMQAYRGSLRHLMTSLVAGTQEQNGFLVYTEDLTKPLSRNNEPPTLYDALHRYKRLLPIRTDSIIRPGKLAFERQLVSSVPLVVFYTAASSAFSPYRDARYAYSSIDLPRRSMLMTTDGWVTVPNGMEVKGSLADDRLSTLLPADWRPDKNGPDSVRETPLVTRGQLLPPDARLGRISTEFTERFANLGPLAYVQIDKSLYATGDRIWFSAYLLDAATQRRPIGETAMQVDLLAPSGRLVQHQWLHVTDGRSAGDFRLSDSLASGTYRLRAYTDEDAGQQRPAFERSILVYNPVRELPAAVPNPPQIPLDVQFLPEGGRWLNDVPARLGIKVVGSDGRGRRVSGRIVDDRGLEVIRFVTNAFGIGSVVMTPQTRYRYYAEVAEADHQLHLTALPKAEDSGLTLAADLVSDSTQLSIEVAKTGTLQADSVYVLFHQRGHLLDGRKLLLQGGRVRLNLPVGTLPPGLLQITLYDATARPQAERLVFVPERLASVRVLLTAGKVRYKPRESVMLNLTLNDEGQPAVAALSASVTDADQLPADTGAASIQTHLLLTGELRGRVEQPDYYFTGNTPETRRDLDDLLLTQGWRRVSGTPNTDLLGGVSVMGQILNAKGQPMPGAQLMMASTNVGQSFVRSAGTDEKGHFRLAGLAIADTLPVLLQVTDRQFKNLTPDEARVVLERAGLSWQSVGADTTLNWDELKAQLAAARIRQESDPNLYRDKTVKLLKEVTVRAKKREERPEDIGRRSLHSTADATVIFDQTATQFPNLYEMIRGRLAGVSITTKADGNGYRVLIRGVSSIMGSTEPLYLMDGMPIPDDDGKALLTFNPGDIERVEVLKNGGSAAIYGVRGGNGVIAFYSKGYRSNTVEKKPQPGMTPFQLIGYPSVQREFYVPRYEADAPPPAENAPLDRRDVLYWKPLIQTDSSGQARLLFPLSDVVRTLRVTVQGITADGRPVTHVGLIRVQ